MCPRKGEAIVQTDISFTKYEHCSKVLINCLNNLKFDDGLPSIIHFTNTHFISNPIDPIKSWKDIFMIFERVINKSYPPNKDETIDFHKSFLNYFIKQPMSSNEQIANSIFSFLNVRNYKK